MITRRGTDKGRRRFILKRPWPARMSRICMDRQYYGINWAWSTDWIVLAASSRIRFGSRQGALCVDDISQSNECRLSSPLAGVGSVMTNCPFMRHIRSIMGSLLRQWRGQRSESKQPGLNINGAERIGRCCRYTHMSLKWCRGRRGGLQVAWSASREQNMSDYNGTRARMSPCRTPASGGQQLGLPSYQKWRQS